MKKILTMIFIAISLLIVQEASAAPLEPEIVIKVNGLNVEALWEPVNGALGYELFYAPYPFMGSHTIKSVNIGSNTQISFNLWSGAAFYIAVKAYNSEESSDYSNIDYFIIGKIGTNLSDTGQIKCYNSAGNEIDCAGTGQDGEFTINPPSFTKNMNATVTDNITGLVWQQYDDGILRNWQEAEKYCNDLSYGGSSAWRLPSYSELVSIVDYSKRAPCIDKDYFKATLIASGVSLFWTDTVTNYNTTAAIAVSFLHGGWGPFSKTEKGFVRCVH